MTNFNPARAVLLLVDIQLDFLPGGSLAIDDGDAIIEPLAALLQSEAFRHVVATQDWHPAGHVSFASSHPNRDAFDTICLYGREQVLWPEHCVAGTPGASLHAGLPWERVDAIIRKGTDPDVDSYSGFRNNFDAAGERPPTGLDGYLKSRGLTDVYVAGLARDYCVKWTAEDAASSGFATTVLWDLTRPVDAASNPIVRESLRELGVALIDSNEFR